MQVTDKHWLVSAQDKQLVLASFPSITGKGPGLKVEERLDTFLGKVRDLSNQRWVIYSGISFCFLLLTVSLFLS